MAHARRIGGRHLLLDGPGAVVDVPVGDRDRVVARARTGLSALGWPGEPASRAHAAAATVAVRAAPDQLRVAVELLEWAADDADDLDDADVLEDLRRRAARDDHPRLRALLAAFPDRAFVDGEELVVGLGVHARVFPLDRLPEPRELGEVRGIPRVTITGTNGKTTTTRLVAHLAMAAGHRAGRSTSDGVFLGREVLEQGDWTGPGAHRRVLRDPRVTFASLETARGGLLRRGLLLDGADVAIVTNVADEHLGEWGVDDLPTMARAKLVTAAGLRPGGTVLLPAYSEPIADVLPELRARRPDLDLRTYWAAPTTGRKVPDGWADDRRMHLGERSIPLDEVPITFGGTARHNVDNALCAAVAALSAGIPFDAVARGLRTFHPSVADNPGRMNTYRLPSGALVVLDFAHNAHGLERIVDTVRRWPRARRVLLLGQAGDRPDVDLELLARAAIPLDAERIVLKRVTGRSYGRPPEEVTTVLARTLVASGYPAARVAGPTEDELAGVRAAIEGATRDHVVVALLHDTLAGALRVLDEVGGVPLAE